MDMNAEFIYSLRFGMEGYINKCCEMAFQYIYIYIYIYGANIMS